MVTTGTIVTNDVLVHNLAATQLMLAVPLVVFFDRVSPGNPAELCQRSARGAVVHRLGGFLHVAEQFVGRDAWLTSGATPRGEPLREQRVERAAEIDERDYEHRDQRKDPRLAVALFHQLAGFVDLYRRADGMFVNANYDCGHIIALLVAECN